jgi:hypothetical protein
MRRLFLEEIESTSRGKREAARRMFCPLEGKSGKAWPGGGMRSRVYLSWILIFTQDLQSRFAPVLRVSKEERLDWKRVGFSKAFRSK